MMEHNFYKSAKWKHKREIILKRDEYLCQECKRYGKTTQATTVHHIIPLTWCLIYNIALALADINLISLCEKCHNKMHDRDSDKLTSFGLAWVKKMGKIGLDWIEKYSEK
jgi:5-methylcytosine-specific restriction endonuclease McrA